MLRLMKAWIKKRREQKVLADHPALQRIKDVADIEGAIIRSLKASSEARAELYGAMDKDLRKRLKRLEAETETQEPKRINSQGSIFPLHGR